MGICGSILSTGLVTSLRSRCRTLIGSQSRRRQRRRGHAGFLDDLLHDRREELVAHARVASVALLALALVVFATWRPGRVLLGAYLFGGVTILQLHVQGAGLDIASQLLSMLPYLATILVLVLISRDQTLIRLNAPADIGKTFRPDT